MAAGDGNRPFTTGKSVVEGGVTASGRVSSTVTSRVSERRRAASMATSSRP